MSCPEARPSEGKADGRRRAGSARGRPRGRNVATGIAAPAHRVALGAGCPPCPAGQAALQTRIGGQPAGIASAARISRTAAMTSRASESQRWTAPGAGLRPTRMVRSRAERPRQRSASDVRYQAAVRRLARDRRHRRLGERAGDARRRRPGRSAGRRRGRARGRRRRGGRATGRPRDRRPRRRQAGAYRGRSRGPRGRRTRASRRGRLEGPRGGDVAGGSGVGHGLLLDRSGRTRRPPLPVDVSRWLARRWATGLCVRSCRGPSGWSR